jgi:putative ABC transport system substrate-binding protein
VKRREFITLLGSAAASWPLATRAQQPGVPVVGFLSGSSPTERASLLAAFQQGLAQSGYIEGQNISIEYRWAEGQYHRLPELGRELVRKPIAVFVAFDGPSALAAKATTTSIPIVFNTGIDPVAIGLVLSLSHPGGNLTGVNMIAGPLPAKQFGLLHEVIRKGTTIALLINPNNANAERDRAIVEEAARAAGRQVIVLLASTEDDFAAVFATLVREQAGALLVNSDVFFTSRHEQIVALAERHAIPVMAAWREFPVAGGLMSYGPSLKDASQQVGFYTAKILGGAKPADLPIIQPTKFDLMINLKTAKTLGIEVPDQLLALADEIVE